VHKWNKYVQNELKTKLNDLNLLEQTINKQYQLLIGLNNDLNISKEQEKALIIDYENIKTKLERNNLMLNKNQLKVKECKKEQERLHNDNLNYGNECCGLSEIDYKKEIVFHTKELNEHKLKLKRNENELKQVKERNKKLERMLILFETKNKTERIENGNVEIKEENESEIIATLRKQIELEKKLDKQLKMHMSKMEN
jgi:hypothetical protein